MSKPDRQLAPTGRAAYLPVEGAPNGLPLVEGCAFAGLLLDNGSLIHESRCPSYADAHHWIVRAKAARERKGSRYNDGTPFPQIARDFVLTIDHVNALFAERDAAQEIAA